MCENMNTVEIITIGNELVTGLILDTNSNWMSKRLSALGGKIQRVVLVKDDLHAIADEIGGALSRNNTLVVTLGGLGPTADDLTLQAVSLVTKSPLREHERALRMVQDKFKELVAHGSVENAELTPERRKMAVLPSGAAALRNSAGAAPGVHIKVGDQHLVSLPGVPTEMRAVFFDELVQVLKEIFGENVFVERTITTSSNDESRLAPVVKEIAEKYPDAYIKSLALRYGPDVQLDIKISISGAEQNQTMASMDAIIADLSDALGRTGIQVIVVK